MQKLLTAAVALILCAPLAWAGQRRSVSATAAARLRHEYYMQDFSRVVEDGKPLLKKYPNDLELHAWYVIAKGYGDELPDIVAQMKKAGPNSPWTLLATAATDESVTDFQTKLDECETAIARSRDDPDVLFLATGILQQAASTQAFLEHPPSAGDLKAFIRKYKGKFKRSPEGLAAEAQALDTVAQIERNTKSKAALKLASRVLKSDPTNVAALLVKSHILVNNKDYQANYDLLKPAAQALPDSYALHLAFWKSVLALPKAKPVWQKHEILADAARIISTAKPSPVIVRTDLSRELGIASRSLETALGDMFLKRYPHSAVEDNVLYSRATAQAGVTEESRDLVIVALEGFIDRPRHYDSNLLAMANSLLVSELTQQKNPDLDRLYKAELAAKESTFGIPATGVVTLANHKFHLPEIEALARSQLDSQWTALQKQLKATPESLLKIRARVFLRYGPARWLDALGWVEFQEGKLETAFPKLEDASKLSPKSSEIAIHVGRAYEAKGENAKAEKTFLSAFAMPYYGEGNDPAIAALRELYIRVHGSTRGLAAYMQPILAKDAARRRTAILGKRLNPEKPIKPFELAALGGKEVGSEGLKGKYLILNFWATW